MPKSKHPSLDENDSVDSAVASDIDSFHPDISQLSMGTRTTTNSTTSSQGSSSIRSILHAPKLRHKKTPESTTAFVFVPPTTPIQLAELAVSTILTWPGVSTEDIKNEVFPRLYWENYSHRPNSREMGLVGLLGIIEMLRSRNRSIRVRFKSTLMDGDGTATMKAAAVGLRFVPFSLSPQNKLVLF